MIRTALLLALLCGCAANTCPIAHQAGLDCTANTWHMQGIPNLASVRPGVYRSGQPTMLEQWRFLAGLGIRHVIKLNEIAEGSDDGARELGMQVHYVPIPPSTLRWESVLEEPSPEAMARLRWLAELIREAPGEGWLVHCQNGHDRTGLVVMLVRIVVDGWTPGQAYEEARRWGYHHQVPGLDKARGNYVKP